MDLPVRLILFAADDLTAISPNVAYAAGQGGAEAILLSAPDTMENHRRDFFAFVLFQEVPDFIRLTNFHIIC